MAMQKRHSLAIIASGFALSIASVAIAQSRVMIWKDVYLGMSKDEFERLYPQKQTNLTEGCPVQVRPRYSSGGIILIALHQGGSMSQTVHSNRMACKEIVISSLVSKYGVPMSEGDVGDGITKKHVAQWITDDDVKIEIHLSSFKMNPEFHIVYSYAPRRRAPEPSAQDNL